MSDNFLDTKPKYCCWVLNYRCMFRCKMCYIWNTHEERVETTLDEKKRFVTALEGFVEPDFEFHLSGGEPLLTEGIFDLIHHINQYHYRTNLVTNGWLVNEETACKLIDAGLGTLTFSLDGFKAETHDFLRGAPRSYERIMKAIDIVHSLGSDLNISLLFLITEKNLDEIIPLVHWVQNHPFLEMISFQAITQPFSQPRDDEWFQKEENKDLWPQDIKKVSQIMNELRHLRQAGYRIGNHHNHFLAFRNYFENPNEFLKKIKCNLGDYEFHVDPYGTVFFCCFTEPIGNMKHDTIKDIWFAPKSRGIRQDVYNCKQNCHIMINCFYEDEVECALKGSVHE